MKLLTKFYLICILAFCLLIHGHSQGSDNAIKVLFTGNSLTYYNGGIDVIFDALTAESDFSFNSTKAYIGNTGLDYRWTTFVRDSVENGGHDYVSIQEMSYEPYEDPGNYHNWALRWDSLAQTEGAKPLHWMNWPKDAKFDTYMETIDSITTLIGDETGSKVVPCGLAWQKILEDHPASGEAYLYVDAVHPTYDGSYLNACLFYAVITGESPIGLPKLTADSATYLQTVAWNTYRRYYSNISDSLKLDIGSDAIDDWIQISESGITQSSHYTINISPDFDGVGTYGAEHESYPSGVEDYGYIGKADAIIRTVISGIYADTINLEIFTSRTTPDRETSIWINNDSITTIDAASNEISVLINNIVVDADSVVIELKEVNTSNYVYLNAVVLYEVGEPAPSYCDTVREPIVLYEVGNDWDGNSNGYINQTISRNAQVVSHSWSNGETTEDLTGLVAGTYYDTIQYVDSGCVFIQEYTVGSSDQCDTIDIIISGNTEHYINSSDYGAIDVSVTGNGIGSLTYDWNDGAYTTEDIDDLLAGAYDIVVTDNVGCSSDSTFVLYNYEITIADSLALYLPFTGDFADSSGNGYTVINSGVTFATDRFGNSNSAIYLDGSSYLSITKEQGLPNVDDEGFTVSFWVKQNTSAADNGDIIGYGYSGNGGFGIGYSASVGYYSTKCFTSTGSKYSLLNTGEYYRMWADKWNMITITYFDGKMRSFVNGGFVEEIEVAGYPSSSYDFVIGGNSRKSSLTTCWVDDVKIYNRRLRDVEVAQISGYSGAIRAAELNTFLLTDFERGELNPAKYEYNWHVYGHVGDDLSYCAAVENPIKTGSNTSDYCMASITFPTLCSGNLMSKETPSRKQEYTIYTEEGDMGDHHHIYQWKVLMYDSSIIEIDSMMWFTNNQIAGNFQLYDARCYAFAGEEGGIYYNGGIFNDNEKQVTSEYVLNPEKRLDWYFRYRVLPDTGLVKYKYDIGKWVTWTYDIFWTKSDTGYWRIYKDGELLSYKDNAITLPGCAPENSELNLAHKFGQYTRWNDYVDGKIDSLTVFYDDIEMYLDPEDDGVTIEDICPECVDPCSGKRVTISSTVASDTSAKGVGAIVITGTGGDEPYTYSWSNGQTTQNISGLAEGPYTVTVTEGSGCTSSKTIDVYTFDPCSVVDITISGAVIPDTLSKGVGAINVSETGGDSPYTYAWSNDATTQDISGLYEGSYSITTTDKNGCSNSKTFTIEDFDPCLLTNIIISGSIKADTSSLGVGQIDISVADGASPYTYEWSNESTSEDISDISAGEYTVTVTDQDGCSSEMIFIVKNLVPGSIDPCDTTTIVIIGEVTDEYQGNEEGSISLTVSGGQSPYSYLWSNGSEASQVKLLSADRYAVTVWDENSCQATESFEIQNDTTDSQEGEEGVKTISAIYIDPENSNDAEENGSLEHPYDSWYDITWTDGMKYLQKRNTEEIVDKIKVSANNITIGAYGEGDNPTLISTSNNYVFGVYDKKNIVFENLNILANDAISNIYFLGGDSCINNSVVSCFLEGAQYGLRIMGGDYFEVKYCTFKNELDGVFVNSPHITLAYNIFKENETGINTSSYYSDVEVYNNVFYDNISGISSSYATLTLYNNIFYLTNEGDIAINQEIDSIISDNNIFFPEQDGFIKLIGQEFKSLKDYSESTGLDVSSFAEDPLFVDVYTDNFNLTDGSPAIDNGRVVGILSDFSGNIVPQQGAPDIGAFESEFAMRTTGSSTLISESRDNIEVYPNPTNGQFVLDIKNMLHEDVDIEIYNLSGRSVYHKQISVSSSHLLNRIDISDHPVGIYQVLVRSTSFSHVEKIIIE